MFLQLLDKLHIEACWERLFIAGNDCKTSGSQGNCIHSYYIPTTGALTQEGDQKDNMMLSSRRHTIIVVNNTFRYLHSEMIRKDRYLSAIGTEGRPLHADGGDVSTRRRKACGATSWSTTALRRTSPSARSTTTRLRCATGRHCYRECRYELKPEWMEG